MMRFTHTIATGAGILFVVPAVAGDGRVDSLRAALAETTRSIELVSGVAERVGEGEGDARRQLLSYTEPPQGDERERDEALFELRQDINHLQLELDAHAAPGSEGLRLPRPRPSGALTPPTGPRGTTPAPAPNGPPPAGAAAPSDDASLDRPPLESPSGLITNPLVDLDPWAAEPRRSTGLDAGTRKLIAGIRAPGSEPEVAVERAAEPAPEAPAEPVEDEGYTADPVRHARACLKAGLHEEGLRVLASAGEGPEVTYWRARLLEAGGDLDRAVEAYAEVAASDSPLAARAADMQEFLVWKRDFERSLGAGAKEAEDQR